MKNVLVGLTAIVLAVTSLGCSHEMSKEEVKKSEEQMQQQNEQMSKDLPAKID